MNFVQNSNWSTSPNKSTTSLQNHRSATKPRCAHAKKSSIPNSANGCTKLKAAGLSLAKPLGFKGIRLLIKCVFGQFCEVVWRRLCKVHQRSLISAVKPASSITTTFPYSSLIRPSRAKSPRWIDAFEAETLASVAMSRWLA